MPPPSGQWSWGGSWGARPPYCSGAPPCAASRLGPRATPARWCGHACRPRPPREQAAGGAGARGVQVQRHPPPPPRVAVPSGERGCPLGPGGRRVPPVALKLWGWSGGGAGGVLHCCPPPRPVGRRPPGVYSCRGGCRVAAGVGRGPVSRQWVSAAGGGGAGGTPLPWFAPPPFPGRPLMGPLRLRRPWRRPSTVGRLRAGREPAGGSPGALAAAAVPPHPGCSGLLGGVRGRCLFGMPLSALGPDGEGGGGGWGGLLVPWRRPVTAEGGRPGSPGSGGEPSAEGSHSSPAPLYPEPDPRAGPRRGPVSPPPPPSGAGRPGAAVRVSGQRLAGCGAVGSPPRSLSPPSLPREVVRAPPSRCIVGGVGRGAQLPPPLPRVCRLGCHLRCRPCGGWGCGGGGLRRR